MSNEEDVNKIALFVQKYIAGHNNLSPDDRLLLVLDKIRIFTLIAPETVKDNIPGATPETIKNVSNTCHYVESYMDALYHEMMQMLYNKPCQGCTDCEDFDDKSDASEPLREEGPTPIADSDIQGSKYLSNMDKVEQLPDWNSCSDVECDEPNIDSVGFVGPTNPCCNNHCNDQGFGCVGPNVSGTRGLMQSRVSDHKRPSKTTNMSSLCSYGSANDGEYDSGE